MARNYLSAEKLTKSFNERRLFEDISFGLEQGQKAALVGVNGCGKSTLLNIIAGEDAPDSGNVSFLKDITVSYLAQEPELNQDLTILDSIYGTNDQKGLLLRDYHALSEKINLNDDEQIELERLVAAIDGSDAWNYEHRAKEILGKLGIKDLSRKIGNLSGGQQKRIALANLLIDQPNVLLLDEPTNHLDLDIIEWLEEYLSKSNLTLLMVTHDRYFLDKVTNEIIEIDRGQLFRYKGNYASYLEQKSERLDLLQIEKDKARSLMKKELEWMRRQPKARGTKAKYRIDEFYRTKEKANVNLASNALDIQISGKRQGKKILEVDKLSKSFEGSVVFKNFSYVFKRGEKIGIVGKNGSGKSTFLNILTGLLKADSGDIDLGLNTQFGYYQQKNEVLDTDQKVLDVVLEVAEVIKLSNGSQVTASQLLNMFLFPPAVQHDFVRKLSGGERRRLQLLRVLMSNPNFLILDEPTNDLDIITLNILEDYLQQFDGCLMLVSHDRYFMDKLVDHLFVFDSSENIKDFPGNYTDYRSADVEASVEIEKTKKENKGREKPKESKKKLSYKEQKEFDQLEKSIPDLEQKKEELISRLNNASGDHSELQSISEEIELITNELDEKEMRWLELSELVE